MNSEMIIRTASEADAPALLEIYAPYVDRTAITFEYEVPSVDEFASRIRNTLQKYPYLVAEKGGRILGYAYAGPFHDRPAYDWSVETSIYVDTYTLITIIACHLGNSTIVTLSTTQFAYGPDTKAL